MNTAHMPQDVMFYAPPEHAAFYPDLLNLIEDAGRGADRSTGSLSPHSSVGLLFCRWDMPALERIVGAARACKMVAAETSTFMFC